MSLGRCRATLRAGCAGQRELPRSARTPRIVPVERVALQRRYSCSAPKRWSRVGFGAGLPLCAPSANVLRAKIRALDELDDTVRGWITVHIVSDAGSIYDEDLTKATGRISVENALRGGRAAQR